MLDEYLFGHKNSLPLITKINLILFVVLASTEGCMMCSFGFHSSCLLSWTFSSYINLDGCRFFFVLSWSYFLCKKWVCFQFIVNIYHSLWSETVNYSNRHNRRNVQAGKSFFFFTALIRLCDSVKKQIQQDNLCQHNFLQKLATGFIFMMLSQSFIQLCSLPLGLC